MARTRHELDRDQKVSEILAAAESRLERDGYAGLSVAGVARDLRLAQNALYWYFPSKDHLFVATLEQMLRAIVARKPSRRKDLEGQVLWFVDQLAEIEHLRAAMHDRARTSEVVAEFAAELDATWQRMLVNVLDGRMPEAEVPLAAVTLLATIQGLLSRGLPVAERRRAVRFAVRRLTAG